MQNIRLISHVNAQGMLHIQLPNELANQDVEITLNLISRDLTKGQQLLEEINRSLEEVEIIQEEQPYLKKMQKLHSNLLGEKW